MDGKRTLIEFKTAASDFEDYEVALLDQVTAYKLAEPEVRQIGVCVLVKTKAPKICWHRTDRTPDQVVEYLEKAETPDRTVCFLQAGRQMVQAVRIRCSFATRAHISAGLFFLSRP